MNDCHDCQQNVLGGEYYSLHDDVWEAAIRPGEDGGHVDFLLCIGCVESRLGRVLRSWDFTEAPVNYAGYAKEGAHRLIDRLGPWYGYFERGGERLPLSMTVPGAFEEMLRRDDLSRTQREVEMRNFK